MTLYQATPLVGKDNPPDLAAFVPSGVLVLSDSVEKAPPIQPPVVTQTTENLKSTFGNWLSNSTIQVLKIINCINMRLLFETDSFQHRLYF